jgi:hypothetical protein
VGKDFPPARTDAFDLGAYAHSSKSVASPARPSLSSRKVLALSAMRYYPTVVLVDCRIKILALCAIMLVGFRGCHGYWLYPLMTH